VVLPAPLRPTKPKISPGATSNSSASTAQTDPNRRVNRRAKIIACPAAEELTIAA
jgi:hypothetical protein